MEQFEPTSGFLASLLESITERIVLVDPRNYNILYANRSFMETYGQSFETIHGKRCFEVTHRKDRPCHLTETECPVKDAFESGKVASSVHVHPRTDGSNEYVRLNAYPVRDQDGNINGVIEASINITVEMNLQEELRKKSELFEKILATSPDGIIGNDRKGNIFLFNSGAEKIFGYSSEEVIGKINVVDLFPPGRAREAKAAIYSDRHGKPGEIQDFETDVIGRDKKWIPIHLAATLLHNQEEEIGTIGFFHDISTKKALREFLQESEERYRGIFESAKEAIVTVGDDRVILKANQAAEEMLGYEKNELTGKNVCEVFPSECMDHWDRIRTLSPRDKAVIEASHAEVGVFNKAGGKIPVQVSFSENRTRARTIFTIIFQNISERIAFEEELRLLSITDSLTKLFNRRHLLPLIEKEQLRANRKKVPFSVLLIDLDRFKSYNDSYGHMEGDNLLVALAELMRKTFRAMDSIFRFGGEEFLALLPETDSIGAMTAAERLRIRLSEIPFQPVPGGDPVVVTASIGVAEYQPGESIDSLLHNADLAMYAAKNSGRNRSVSYELVVAQAFKPPAGE